jgi:hypothetical protein
MSRVEEVERRLLNWARWRIGGSSGGLGFAKTSMGNQSGGSRYRESVIPTNAAEAMETDDAVKGLEADLRDVVEQHYGEGLSVALVAVRRGRSAATIYARLDRAHAVLDQVFRDRAYARRAERERVASIVRGGFRD